MSLLLRRRAMLMAAAATIPPLSDSNWCDFWGFDSNSAVGLNGKSFSVTDVGSISSISSNKIDFQTGSDTDNSRAATFTSVSTTKYTFAYVAPVSSSPWANQIQAPWMVVRSGVGGNYFGLYLLGASGTSGYSSAGVYVRGNISGSDYAWRVGAMPSAGRHHFAMVVNGSSVTVYVDGASIGSVTVTASSAFACLTIGARGNQSAYADDICLYNDILSPAQIALLAAGGRPLAVIPPLSDSGWLGAWDFATSGRTSLTGSAAMTTCSPYTLTSYDSANGRIGSNANEYQRIAMASVSVTGKPFTFGGFFIQGSSGTSSNPALLACTSTGGANAVGFDMRSGVYYNGAYQYSGNLWSGTTTHLAFVCYASTVDIYRNGTYWITINVSLTLPGGGATLFGHYGGTNENGYLDNLFMYNGTLTPGHIALLAAGGLPS